MFTGGGGGGGGHRGEEVCTEEKSGREKDQSHKMDPQYEESL